MGRGTPCNAGGAQVSDMHTPPGVGGAAPAAAPVMGTSALYNEQARIRAQYPFHNPTSTPAPVPMGSNYGQPTALGSFGAEFGADFARPPSGYGSMPGAAPRYNMAATDHTKAMFDEKTVSSPAYQYTEISTQSWMELTRDLPDWTPSVDKEPTHLG